MDTFKDLVTLKEDRKTWNKSILITWLSHGKSKRRQNGGAACVATVEWMQKNSLRGHVLGHVTLANFFSAAFCHFCHHEKVQMVPEKCLKISYLLLESLNSCGKLWCCKVAVQFAHFELCPLSLSSCSCWTGKRAFQLGIKFRDYAKEEAKNNEIHGWTQFPTKNFY